MHSLFCTYPCTHETLQLTIWRVEQSVWDSTVRGEWEYCRECHTVTAFHSSETRFLRFVNQLLQTFCALDICRALTGTYPAYIADVLSSYYHTRLVLGGLHIARTDSTLLDNIYRKVHSFEIGPFKFRLTEWLEYEHFPDYSIYDITHECVTITVHITTVDVSAYCGYRSNINLAEFILGIYICICCQM